MVQRLQSTGVYQHLEEKYDYKRPRRAESSESPESSESAGASLSVAHLTVHLLLLAAGAAISVATFLAELALGWITRRRKG